VSVITDECLPDRLKAADIKQIIAAANLAEPKLKTLFKRIVKEVPKASSK